MLPVQPGTADQDQDECGDAEDADKATEAEADPPECATRGHEAPGWESECWPPLPGQSPTDKVRAGPDQSRRSKRVLAGLLGAWLRAGQRPLDASIGN